MRGDLEWVSTPRLVESAAERFPEVEALVDGNLALTYAELPAAMYRSARAAIAAGLEPGDRAAIWAPNSAAWVLAALGIQAAGGVLVPVNTRFKGDEAAWVLGKSGARLLFTVNGFLDTDYVALLDAAGADLPALETIVLLDGEPPAGTVSWEEYLDRGDAVPAAEAEARAAAITGDDLADILFTSGTTGRPKGAMTTHGQNLRVFEVYTAALGLREGDRYLIVNPFFHSFGYKAGWLSSIMRGATILPQPVFDVPAVLDRVERDASPCSPDHRRSCRGFRPPRPRPLRPLVPAAHDHRVGVGPGRAHQASPGGDDLRDDPDRLRAHRDERGRLGVQPRRRPRDDRVLVGPAISDIEVKVVDDDGREVPAWGGRRGPGPRLQRHARLLGGARADRGDDRRRGLALTRAISGSSTTATT